MDKTFAEKLTAVRREIHQHPELGEKEFRTTEFLQKQLHAAGITTKRITKTGLVATITGEARTTKAKKTFALRADIDALPIQEMTGKSYASKVPGVMHACGHDANCTMNLGAALLLQQQRKEFAGTVKLLFQPNEETSGGAKTMITAGCLKKPDVDAIAGIHVSPWLPLGVLGLKHEEMMAGVDRFTIDIIGEGGHGAYPHLTTDAVVVAAHAVVALQSIVAREIEPVSPVVVTVGSIHGGEQYNIISGKVRLVGTVRTLNNTIRGKVRRLIEQKLRHVTAAFGATYKMEYEALGSPLINDEKVLELCRESGAAVLGAGKVEMLRHPSMGGEDFAEYLQEVPGCFMYIGGSPAGKKAYPWHHEKFDIDERVLPLGAMVMADVAKRFLNR